MPKPNYVPGVTPPKSHGQLLEDAANAISRRLTGQAAFDSAMKEKIDNAARTGSADEGGKLYGIAPMSGNPLYDEAARAVAAGQIPPGYQDAAVELEEVAPQSNYHQVLEGGILGSLPEEGAAATGAGGPKLKTTGSMTWTGLDAKHKEIIDKSEAAGQEAANKVRREVEDESREVAATGIKDMQGTIEKVRDQAKEQETHLLGTRLWKMAADSLAEDDRDLHAKAVKKGIDPSKTWKEMKGTQKAAFYISTMFDSIGAGMMALAGKDNKMQRMAQKMLEAAIDRDIAAQRANIMNLAKIAGMSEQKAERLGNMVLKEQAGYRGTMQDLASLQLKKHAIMKENPETRVNLWKLAEGVRQKAQQVRAQTATRWSEKNLKFGYPGSGKVSGGGLRKAAAGATKKLLGAMPEDSSRKAILKAMHKGMPHQWVRPLTRKAGKGRLEFATHGKIKIAGKWAKVGHPGMDVAKWNSRMSDVVKRGVGKQVSALRDIVSMYQYTKANIGKGYSVKAAVKQYAPWTDEKLWNSVKDAIGITLAVEAQHGRTSEPENKAWQMQMPAPQLGTEQGKKRLRIFVRGMKANLKRMVGTYNPEYSNPVPLLMLEAELNNVLRIIPKSAGGYMKELN